MKGWEWGMVGGALCACSLPQAGSVGAEGEPGVGGIRQIIGACGSDGSFVGLPASSRPCGCKCVRGPQTGAEERGFATRLTTAVLMTLANCKAVAVSPNVALASHWPFMFHCPQSGLLHAAFDDPGTATARVE